MEEARHHRTSLAVFLTFLVAVLLFSAVMLLPYVLAVLMGGILALLCDPVYRQLLQKNLRPKVASAAVTFIIIFLVIVPLFTFLAIAVKEGVSIGQEFLQDNHFTLQTVARQLNRLRPVRVFYGGSEGVHASLQSGVQSLVKNLSSAVLVWAGMLPNILLQLALASIACFFFLIDGRKFLAWTSDKIPLDPDVRHEIKDSFKNTAISVIWANLAAAGTQAAILLLAFLALQVPGAFLAGGATFILAWLPMVGAVPVWAAGAVYLYFQDRMAAMTAMIVFGLIAGISDNVVRPMVLKGHGDMHPLVSLVAIFAGINMFGIAGVFVGPICAAVLISLLDIWPVIGRRFGLTRQLEER